MYVRSRQTEKMVYPMIKTNYIYHNKRNYCGGIYRTDAYQEARFRDLHLTSQLTSSCGYEYFGLSSSKFILWLYKYMTGQWTVPCRLQCSHEWSSQTSIPNKQSSPTMSYFKILCSTSKRVLAGEVNFE